MFRPTLALSVNNARITLDEGLRAIEAGQVHMDLAQVPFVDSAAVAVLLEWKRSASRKGQALTFSNLPANLTSLAELYGVTDLLHS